MIGLDTNILVRILTSDDRVQTERAIRFIRDHCSPAIPGFINCIVLAELVWVLTNLYDFRRADVAQGLERLLASRDLAFDAREQVNSAILTYKSTKCDFIDAMIGEINRLRGCATTATFDRGVAKLEGFVRVS
jgi:predicted nucleic-acid-binding protein